MALLPPAPPVPKNKDQQQTAYQNATFWSNWYEQLRTLVNNISQGLSWTVITDKPTTLAGYGITDAAPLSHVGSGGGAHSAATTAVNGFMSSTDKAKLDLITSGTYTPTLTNVANLDSSATYAAQYIRVGSVITVSGRVDIDPTAAGSVRLGISLPVASAFVSARQCAGTASATSVAGQSAAILADVANARAELQYIAVDTASRAMYYTFTYTVV